MRHVSNALIFAAALAAASCGPRNKDKLDDNELAGAEGSPSATADSRCTDRVVTDEIKRQLFARAAEIRGSNGDNYAKIASFALIDVSGAVPVAAVSAGELVDCRGHVTLRLPAGLKVAGGRTALGGDVGYSVAPGARGIVTLGQSDAIAIPLATLTQNRAAAPSTPSPPAAPLQPSAPQPEPSMIPVPTVRNAPRAPSPAPAPAPVAAPREVSSSGRPSFDCRRARTLGERSVCGSPSLAALDRTMASQYRGAVASAGPDQRRLLAQTRDRFLNYRDRCGSDSCIANAYRGRMREIDDILAGRWQAPR